MKNSNLQRHLYPAVPKAKTLLVEKDIYVPASSVWEIIGNFSEFDRFTDGLGKCQMIGDGVGQVRVKTFDSGDYVVDQLSFFDKENMQLHFNIISTSLNIRHLWEFLHVEKISDTHSKVIWELAGEPKSGSQEDLDAFLYKFATGALENISNICSNNK